MVDAAYDASSQGVKGGLTKVEALVTIVVMAIGNVAQEPMLPLCIRALRGLGEWRGRIRVLTDQLASVPATCEGVFLHVDTKCGTKGYKLAKMRALQAAASNYVFYMDIDIIAAKPIVPLLQSALEKINNADLLVYNESAVTPDSKAHTRLRKEIYHGGAFFAASRHSNQCLKSWEASMLLALQAQESPRRRFRDQTILAEIALSSKCKLDWLPSHTMVKPSTHIIEHRQYAILNHLSRSSRLGFPNTHHLTASHFIAIGKDLLQLEDSEANSQWWISLPSSAATLVSDVRRVESSSVSSVMIECP